MKSNMDSRLRGNDGRLRVFLLAVLLASPVHARMCEAPGELYAAELVDAALLSSNLHTVRPCAEVRGHLARFTLDTPYGAIVADSPAAAAQGSDATIAMLPSDDALQDVASSLLDHLGPGQIFVDMGTSRLATSLRLAARVAERGAQMLDAPVTGGEAGAQQLAIHDESICSMAFSFVSCRPWQKKPEPKNRTEIPETETSPKPSNPK